MGLALMHDRVCCVPASRDSHDTSRNGLAAHRSGEAVTGDSQGRILHWLIAVLQLTGICAGQISLLLLRRIASAGLLRSCHSRLAGRGSGLCDSLVTRLRLWLRGVCISHCRRRVCILRRRNEPCAGNRRHHHNGDAQDEKIDGALSHGSSPLLLRNL